MPRLILCLCLIGVALSPALAQDVATLRAEADRLTAAREWTPLLEVLGQLRTMAASTGDRAAEAEALRRLGLTQQQLKSYDAARASFADALAIVVAEGQQAAAGQLHDDLGNLSWTIGDWAGQRKHNGAAAETFAALGLRDRQANSLRNMAFARDISLAERITLIERAIAVASDSQDRRLRGLLQHMYGDLLCVRTDYDGCLDALEAAIPLLGDAPRELSLALTSLGRTYRIHGLFDRALDTYARALKIQEGLGDQYAVAQTYDAMGVALTEAGRRQEAVAAHARAFGNSDGARNNRQSYAINYAIALNKIGDDSRALAVLEPLASQKMLDDEQARFHNVRSMVYRGIGRHDDALAEAELAVAIMSRAAGRDEFNWYALEARALAHLALGHDAAALTDATEALRQLEQIRARAVPRDAMRAGFVERHRELSALAIRLSRDSGDAAGAFETAERARARAFADLLATRNLDRSSAHDHAAELPNAIVTPAASLDSLRPVLAAAQTTLLAYWVGPDETTIWLVPATGAITTAKIAFKSTRYETLTQQIWQVGAARSTSDMQLTARSGTRLTLGGDPRPALRELYDVLIKPIEAALPARAGSLLTIVPHGPLFGVPFAALTDAKQKYLIETYRLHHVASAALLQPPAHVNGSAKVLLVGDPAPLPKVTGAALSPLPGARTEVRAITAAMPQGAAASLIGAEATEARVRSMTATRQALHFATHGIVYNDRPFDSFLALAPDRAGGDGRLTTSDIYSMRLNADLVVLSACRTATGQLSGDGVQGLARAFFYAGTPAVIATLWDLPDGPSRHLFPEFYRAWTAGAERSAALRDAQLSLIRALRRGAITVDTPLGAVTLPEHPAIWAAPVLLGQP